MYPELYSLKNLEKRQVEHNKQTSTNLLKDINPDDIKARACDLIESKLKLTWFLIWSF